MVVSVDVITNTLAIDVRKSLKVEGTRKVMFLLSCMSWFSAVCGVSVLLQTSANILQVRYTCAIFLLFSDPLTATSEAVPKGKKRPNCYCQFIFDNNCSVEKHQTSGQKMYRI